MVGDPRNLKVSRRHFVGLGCLLLPGTISALRATAMKYSSAPLFVIIDDIPEDIDPSLVEDVFSEFSERGIPFACVVDINRLNAAESRSSSALDETIRAITARGAGMMEVILPINQEIDTKRYFQMRAAEELRASATAFLVGSAQERSQSPIVSLMDRSEMELVDLPAYRSAGFRVLIRPGALGAMRTDFEGRGQMRLAGSSALSATDPPKKIRAQLDEWLSSERDRMLVLSLSDVAAADANRVRRGIAEVASRIEAARTSGLVVPMRPMDHLLATGPYLSADRAIVLQAGEVGAEQATVGRFAEELRRSDLPFSVTGAAGPDWLTDTDDFCPVWVDAAAGQEGKRRGADSWLFSPAAAPIPAPDRVPGVMVVPGEGDAWNGVRGDGRMHMVFREWAHAGPADEAPFEDIVLVIRPDDIALPMQREALLHQLVSASREGRIRLHTVAGLAELVLAPEPVLARLWTTRQRMASDPPRTRGLSARERAMLVDDASLAWTFIDRFTDPATGLCAGTVREGPDMRVNREASMWDLASQMQGIIAARSIGLIATEEARDRIQLMLQNIPLIELGGLNLPPAMFLTDSQARVAVRGFDICDTGRFLVALQSALAAGLAREVDVAATRTQWDLAEMVQDGQAFNITGGRRVDVTLSHCTPYIAHPFAELGLPLRSPYSPLGEPSDADGPVRLLYSAAFIGSLGSEPLLLETIEQGASPESAFLSAVLFDAQLSWFETTGQMKSVSEAPLNIEPWFIYQGLRVDRLGEAAWTIESPNGLPRHQTAEFRRNAEVLSAKSAYLWAAVHPHPYCDRLIGLMRDKARIENLGFSVGVFARSSEAMENYSDLNTNGIILSAIAAMLEPSWPNP